ncbi:MAG: hypothetical protein QF745_08640 [Planctomycetota bacterium]|nr:hypothetical protein [Planctomycetota bacterium]
MMGFFGCSFYADEVKAAEYPVNVNIYRENVAAGCLHESDVGRLYADSLMSGEKGNRLFGALFVKELERNIPFFFLEPPQESADALGLLVA